MSGGASSSRRRSRPQKEPQSQPQQTPPQRQSSRRRQLQQQRSEDDAEEERRVFDQIPAGDEDDEEEEQGEEESGEEEDLEEVDAEDDEDFEAIPLASLPPLPALVYRDEYKSTLITVKPPLKELAEAHEECHDWIRLYINEKVPNLSFVLSIPTDPTFIGIAGSVLFQGRLVSQKKNVVWYSINGFSIRFSKQEFVLCSGLIMKMKRNYSKRRIETVGSDTSFADTYFPDVRGSDPIRHEHVIKAIRLFSINKVRGHTDRLKDKDRRVMASLVLGLALTHYLRGGGTCGLPRPMWSIIADLEFCNTYDWGNWVWESMLVEMKADVYKWKRSDFITTGKKGVNFTEIENVKNSNSYYSIFLST